MVKPDTGWLHDDRALNAGRGVFVQFTVTWTGSIELPSSIRGLGVAFWCSTCAVTVL